MDPNCLVAEQKLVCLVYNSPTSDTVTHRLDPESSVIIGSDERCGMRITASTISDRHCMIRYVDSEILVMDWFSEFGTFVNDRRISEETRVRANDILRLGEHELKILKHDLGIRHQTPPAVFSPIVTLLPEASTYDLGEITEAEPSLPSAESISDDFDSVDGESEPYPSRARLQVELAHAQDELAFLRQELGAQLVKPAAAQHSSPDVDSAAQVEIDMLRGEIVQLQTELAERDAALFTTWGQDSEACPTQTDPKSADTEVLVERLEQMLDELQSADRRVATLDDLLRSSADEHRADLEEREQLENWVSEIEQRITEREESWKAERNRLEAKISELIAQREQSAQTLSESVRAQGGESAQKLVADLQRKYDRALEQLDSAQQEICKLQKIVKRAPDSNLHAKRVHELEDLIRKREVEISQERASLARQRAEMDRAKVEIEREPRSLDRADENALRIQAFRDHLRGIHEQEKIERKEQRANSLAGRIAQLWQRLEGNDR